MAKCCECGYLSVRMKGDYSLGEASSDFRDRGAVAQGTDNVGLNPHALHEPIPLCFARQEYLKAATSAIKNRGNPSTEVREIIQKENNCSEAISWQQGFTPKEHREMEDRVQLRRWQAEREEADKKWRSGQESKNRRFYLIAVLSGASVGALLTWLVTYLAACQPG